MTSSYSEECIIILLNKGYSYSDISKLTGIAVSTLWFKYHDKVNLSPEAVEFKNRKTSEKITKHNNKSYAEKGIFELNSNEEIVKKKCPKCKLMLDLSEFYVHMDYYRNKHKRHNKCKTCDKIEIANNNRIRAQKNK